LEYFRVQLENENTDPSNRKLLNENRKKVFNHIRQNLVAPTIFTNYVYNKLCEDYDSVWHFKKHFVTQLSVCSLVGYLFSTEKRSLFNCAISPQTAQIFNRNYYPQYATNGLLAQPQFVSFDTDDPKQPIEPEENDPEFSINTLDSTAVPFLLSNNMDYFIGPTARHGIFSTVMLASVLTLGEPDVLVQVKDRLRLYFQDDILDWTQHNKNETSDGKFDVVPLVEENTKNVSEKILALTPEVRADLEVDSSVPINTQVVELLNAAIDPENVSKLDTTLFPWF